MVGECTWSRDVASGRRGPARADGPKFARGAVGPWPGADGVEGGQRGPQQVVTTLTALAGASEALGVSKLDACVVKNPAVGSLHRKRAVEQARGFVIVVRRSCRATAGDKSQAG
jgi:hypothetical protein